MSIFYGLGLAFTVWMAVEAVRRGQALPWLFIILFFPPIGAAVYFFVNVAPNSFQGFGFVTPTRRTTAADLRRAHAEVRRLDNASTWTTYATLLRERGQHALALEAADQALRRDPQEIDAQYERGRALLQTSRTAEGIAALEIVLANNRSFDSQNALLLLASAHEAQGNLAAARAELEELAGRSSQPRALYQLGTIQARMGDKELARQTFTRIIDEAEYVPRYLQRTVRPWVRKARKALPQLSSP
jgi:hypothetical protein